MKLNQQLQILIDEAPQQGVPVAVMEKAIVPVLKAFASQLQRLKYYVLQSRDREWIVTTIGNIERPQQEKQVIYAFSTAEDAADVGQNSELSVEPESIPVTHLLFQLFSLDGVDSIVFLETPGNLEKGVEIYRNSLQTSIQKQLQQSIPSRKNIPSNLA